MKRKMSLDTRDVALEETTTAIPPLPHDMCRTDAQCLHGGTCVVFKPGQIKSAVDDEYNYCSCLEGYGGHRCESNCPLQCMNGGLCHPKSAYFGTVKLHDTNPYVCQCLGHYTGMLCDIPYENCADGSQCYYGGTCRERQEAITVYYCECPSSRGGVSCQNEVTEIETNSDIQPQRNTIKLQIKYVPLAIVLVIVSFFGIGLVLMRRRRRRNERRYHAIQLSEDHQSGIETRQLRTKQEKWRNIV
jgi:hypothetical protein